MSHYLFALIVILLTTVAASAKTLWEVCPPGKACTLCDEPQRLIDYQTPSSRIKQVIKTIQDYPQPYQPTSWGLTVDEMERMLIIKETKDPKPNDGSLVGRTAMDVWNGIFAWGNWVERVYSFGAPFIQFSTTDGAHYEVRVRYAAGNTRPLQAHASSENVARMEHEYADLWELTRFFGSNRVCSGEISFVQLCPALLTAQTSDDAPLIDLCQNDNSCRQSVRGLCYTDMWSQSHSFSRGCNMYRAFSREFPIYDATFVDDMKGHLPPAKWDDITISYSIQGDAETVAAGLIGYMFGTLSRDAGSSFSDGENALGYTSDLTPAVITVTNYCVMKRTVEWLASGSISTHRAYLIDAFGEADSLMLGANQTIKDLDDYYIPKRNETQEAIRSALMTSSQIIGFGRPSDSNPLAVVKRIENARRPPPLQQSGKPASKPSQPVKPR